MSNSSIWPIDRTLSGTTILGQDGYGNNGNEEYSIFPKAPQTWASPSDGLMSSSGHSLGGGESYLSAEMQSVYSTALADWALCLDIFDLQMKLPLDSEGNL